MELVVFRKCTVGLIVFISLSAQGQMAATPEMKKKEEDSSTGFVRNLTSPITTRANRILFSGAALTLISLAIEHSTDNQFQRDVATSKPLGDSAKYGDLMGQLIPNAVYSLGMLGASYLYADDSKKMKAFSRSIFMLESSLYAAAATTVLKYTVNEPRPNNSDHYSFPSGHSTTAFSFAAVVGLEHEWYFAVPAYSLAAFVGLSRINDNMHFLHDVIGGATVGISYAFGIWYTRHQDQIRKETDSKASEYNFIVLPTGDLSGSVLSWNYRF